LPTGATVWLEDQQQRHAAAVEHGGRRPTGAIARTASGRHEQEGDDVPVENLGEAGEDEHGEGRQGEDSGGQLPGAPGEFALGLRVKISRRRRPQTAR
jgi:hypothetical protein